MLDTAGTFHGKQSQFFVAALDSLQAPQRVVKAITLQDNHNSQRFVITFGFAQICE
jgi:hypothetical protein